MNAKLKIVVIAAALAAGTSGAAMAQYACPPGYTYYGGACNPYAPNNPVSGAAQGAAEGAAAGGAAGGPVGAIVGGAVGTATGTVAGTVNAVAGAPVAGAYGSVPPAPACAAGYVYYSGGCYPAR